MGRTRTRAATGIVLDAGALIALDRGDKRMIALLQRAAQGRTFRVPAGVVGQAWINPLRTAKRTESLRGSLTSPLGSGVSRTVFIW